MELVQSLFQERLSGQKYFLVLDDVWNENRDKWLQLKHFLALGQVGSRIVVTTRSEMTATIIGDKHSYKLKGLSEENSWTLFEMSAFNEEDEQENHSELVEIGKNVVPKCYNIPLAIKVVGSLLYGQDISKWRSFEERGLADIKRGENEIMSILKLSYHNLDSSLKSCFSYCAVFPKDYRVRKDMLISFWMAQGYIFPFDRGQSIEDAAEEHFFILLRRCFFQDVEKDAYGRVASVKIHDLMHDVAQEVGGQEFCVVSSITNHLADQTRHVSYVGEGYGENSSSTTKMRSFFHYNAYGNFVITQVDRWTCLRVLELRHLAPGSSLDSVGKLMHLRSLNLFENDFEVLPNSITKLHNLQTLVLGGSKNLRELPKEFNKLVKLRHLDLRYCNKLSGMPSGMHKLTSLRMLPFFVVGMGERSSPEKQCDAELNDLKSLVNINGGLHIKIGETYLDVEAKNGLQGGAYLKNIKHLLQAEIEFDGVLDRCVESEVVMEKLEPHSNIKGFILIGYKGRTIPRWGRAENNNWAISFPRLVKIEFTFCENIEKMPLLSKLPYLKSLILVSLDKLEYMEDTSNIDDKEDPTIFFPSLENLQITELKSLKGWQSPCPSVVIDQRRLKFPRLSSLKIQWCHNLTSFPLCPCLEDLELCGMGNSERLGTIVNLRDKQEANTAGNSSLLRSFKIEGCENLRKLSGLEHLIIGLESLEISGNEQLSIIEDDDDDDGMPWKSLHQSLRSLTFKSLQSIKTLPKGVQHLTSLQSLELCWCDAFTTLPEWIGCLSSLQSMSIRYCDTLKSLPESMRNLTALQRLEIGGCPDLEERCKVPNGEDRPKIQHIPHVDIIKWR